MARIVVVEDDGQLRKVLRTMLERAGHDVDEAADGSEALNICHENPPQVVVTDIIMPGTDGIKVIQELRKDLPEVGVIAISGGGYIGPRDYLHAARIAGATQTLTKPITADELIGAVDDLLGEP